MCWWTLTQVASTGDPGAHGGSAASAASGIYHLMAHWQGTNIVKAYHQLCFFTIDKAHHNASWGLISPNGPTDKLPPPKCLQHLQTIHSTPMCSGWKLLMSLNGYLSRCLNRTFGFWGWGSFLGSNCWKGLWLSGNNLWDLHRHLVGHCVNWSFDLIQLGINYILMCRQSTVLDIPFPGLLGLGLAFPLSHAYCPFCFLKCVARLGCFCCIGPWSTIQLH